MGKPTKNKTPAPPRTPTSGTSQPDPNQQLDTVAETTPTTGATITTGPLSRQFESCLKSITRLAGFIDQPEFAVLTRIETETRLERLEQLWAKAQGLHDLIIGQLEEGNVMECQGKLDLTEDCYFLTKATFQRKIAETVLPNVATEAQDRPVNVNLKLPERVHDIKNTWGTFDGTLLKWHSFRDCFVARIHNDESIPNVYKFSYLKNSLSGRAEKTLGEWHLTEDSYAEAWSRLLQVYDKEYPIIREHLRQFERLPAITGPPTSNELQRLSNVTHETLRQLRAMQLPVYSWDMIVVHHLHERLDSDTAKEWERHRTSERPTATEMLEFLDKQASISLSASDLKVKADLRVSVKNDRSRATELAGPSNANVPRSSTPYETATRHNPCEACNSNHPLYYCEDYLSLSLNVRWAFVRKRNLCPNCLKRGHNKESCFSTKCSDERCKAKDPLHNSTLCPYKVGTQNVMAVRNATKESQ